LLYEDIFDFDEEKRKERNKEEDGGVLNREMR
jgi:hypothetical protein